VLGWWGCEKCCCYGYTVCRHLPYKHLLWNFLSTLGFSRSPLSLCPLQHPLNLLWPVGLNSLLTPATFPWEQSRWEKGHSLGMQIFPSLTFLNMFHHCWFLSVDHLRAQALLAQKAEDGKFFWVEFTPPFHTHLVKCTVVLVLQLIEKVKKVMFMYILELLNWEGHQTFFDLAKGQRLATQAQKEKWQLAWRRNHALRQESQKAAEEAKEGQPHWQCRACRWKFASVLCQLHNCSQSHQLSPILTTCNHKQP
jgi:hypothetical protein